jgi:hypothetical protein
MMLGAKEDDIDAFFDEGIISAMRCREEQLVQSMVFSLKEKFPIYFFYKTGIFRKELQRQMQESHKKVEVLEVRLKDADRERDIFRGKIDRRRRRADEQRRAHYKEILMLREMLLCAASGVSPNFDALPTSCMLLNWFIINCCQFHTP